MRWWIATGVAITGLLGMLWLFDNHTQCHWCGNRVRSRASLSRDVVYRYNHKHLVTRFTYCTHTCMTEHRAFVERTSGQR